MLANPLRGLRTKGQCVWLDNLHRRMLADGDLARMIERDGLHGVTSNPAIFKKAIADSDDYDARIAVLAGEGAVAEEIYRCLAVADVREAADLLRPLHDSTDGAHGFVSLEVDPRLAHDTAGTLAEARELWHLVERPNVMIKVPATDEGLPAIRDLIAAGINVNVTLLFGLKRYREVAAAHVAGLRARRDAGLPMGRVASVASFFLSRIDTKVDARLDEIIAAGGPRAEQARALRGEAAVAGAREAYRIFGEVYSPDAFGGFAVRGARPQRLLWASTSTKDPAYDDLKYVEALVGPETVTTLPDATLDAFRDHGRPEVRLEDRTGRSAAILADLEALGVDMDAVASELEAEGVKKFTEPFGELLSALETRRQEAVHPPAAPQILDLKGHRAAADATVRRLADADAPARIWSGDPSFWRDDGAGTDGETPVLGWLAAVRALRPRASEIMDFAAGVRDEGITHVVLADTGVGGATTRVMTTLCSRAADAPELIVLDTTDPATVGRLRDRLPLKTTLLVLSSRSQDAPEALAHGDLFRALMDEAEDGGAAHRCVAITDAETPLAELAGEQGFRAVFLNDPVGSDRFATFSHAGLVPAALHGVDVTGLLVRAERMLQACGPDVPADDNPALCLGAALAALAAAGRDKITFILPPRLADFGPWLEQLLAAGNGRSDRGLFPVVDEPLGPPAVYGDDRVFVRFTLGGHHHAGEAQALAALAKAGHPLLTCVLGEPLDVAQEFVRWQIAVAVAARELGVSPFRESRRAEQADIPARLLRGEAPAPVPPTHRDGGLAFTGDDTVEQPADLLRSFCCTGGPGRCLALSAFLPPDDPDVTAGLARLRLLLRDRLQVATTLGFAPRHRHACSRLHRDGPERVGILQLISEPTLDLEIPGRGFTLGELQRAEADGELLERRALRRPVLRVDLGRNAVKGLANLQTLLEKAVVEFQAMEGES